MADIAARNPDDPPHQVDSFCREIRRLLLKSGSCNRYVRDRAAGETALPLILNAAREALCRASLDASQIDLLIYCGVGRGFLEPAMAYFVARSLGISCQCFDVLDACMSWLRALHIAHQFLSGGVYSRVLIVNGEFGFYEHGYPQLLQGTSLEKLRYTFPAYTIGEAATATIVTASDDPWNFHFRSDPSRVNLCALPLAGHAEFSESDDLLALNGDNLFVSFGYELSRVALEETVRFIQHIYPERSGFDWWFPHAASAELCRKAETLLQLDGKVAYHVYPHYGNLVSASIPASLHLMLEERRLQRGHRVVLCPASAGMAFALVDFVY